MMCIQAQRRAEEARRNMEEDRAFPGSRLSRDYTTRLCVDGWFSHYKDSY